MGYLPCNEDIEEVNYGLAYLCVHNHETCMEAFNYTLCQNDYYSGFCMPDEKPSDCQDETWEELGKYRHGSNYGLPIENCTGLIERHNETMNDCPETDEWVEIELLTFEQTF